jgi:hypothetical protein
LRFCASSFARPAADVRADFRHCFICSTHPVRTYHEAMAKPKVQRRMSMGDELRSRLGCTLSERASAAVVFNKLDIWVVD